MNFLLVRRFLNQHSASHLSKINFSNTSATWNENEHKIIPLYDGHIPLSFMQRAILSVGSSYICLTNPARGDMVAVNGETSASIALQKMHKRMNEDVTGSLILAERPVINSSTVDLEKLKTYPENSLGKQYSNFLHVNNVSPDSRLPVRFVDDVDLAYVMQRYRETHDLLHTILGMPTNLLGEITVKWVEAIQTGLPMCIGGAIFGPARLKPKNRAAYLKTHLPWAIRVGINSKFLMNVYYEQRWDQDIDELRSELKIESPP